MKDKYNSENQVNELKRELEHSQSDLTRAYELLNVRKKDVEIYMKENDELRKEIYKVTSEKSSLDSEVHRLKDQILLLNTEVNNL